MTHNVCRILLQCGLAKRFVVNYWVLNKDKMARDLQISLSHNNAKIQYGRSWCVKSMSGK